MKKFLALLLVFATLLSVLVACAEGENGDDTDTVAAEESQDPSKLDNIPDDLKFDGEDVVIISRAFLGWTWDEVAVPELNSEPVNDAIFNRNVKVGDRLNINIVPHAIEDADQSKPITEVQQAVLY